jgi:hypothetical protein
VPAEGLVYPVPTARFASGVRVSGNDSHGDLKLSGGLLPETSGQDLTVPLTITSPNVVQVNEPNPLKVKVKANAKDAVFSGSFVHPVTGKTLKFHGAFQAAFGSTPAIGKGCFLDNELTGSVRRHYTPIYP